MSNESSSKRKSWVLLLLLVLAGEGIFVLPFILVRIFRPTFLEVYELTNEQMGYCFSTYGIVALVSYLLGGSLADKFKPRYLIAISLWMTAAAGFWMSTMPSYDQMIIIYGCFGFSTIFLFWSALIKTTRIWGGELSQGKAFGILDGGRGLVGSAFGILGLAVFATVVSGPDLNVPLAEKKEIFSSVVLYSSAFVAIIGVLVFIGLRIKDDGVTIKKSTLENYKACLQLPAVWTLMVIILAAYVGYKSTDYFSQFANEVMLYDDVQSGKIGTAMLFLRALTAVVIGFIADKYLGQRMLIISFAVMALGSALIASGLMDPSINFLFLLTIFIAGVGVYAARALYFAVMQAGKIPLALTGTAVGIISIIGYTPDIFYGPLSGRIIDQNPGEIGHQMVFGITAFSACIGLLASLYYSRICKA